ncbi:MAG: glycosyltransferase family 4 protein [Deltaproteobacteria bacterium]|nr:glycosyltransferase family 4 protein [Deltaproteobacteria bacterium]
MDPNSSTSDNPRRLLLINYEYPPLGGGGGHASQMICRHLVRMGWEVSVLTSRFDDQPKEEDDEGVRVFRIPTLRRYKEKCSVFEMAIFLIMSVLCAPSIYKKTKPDCVLTFFSIPSGPAAWFLKELYRVPYVVALRGGDVPGFLPEQLATFHKLSSWLTRLVWRGAKALTTNSQGLKNLALAFDQQTPIHVIPNGVDERFFLKRNFTAPKPILYAVTVGRLSEQKKLFRLLQVWKQLQGEGLMSIKLNIVGDGPLRDRLETQSQSDGTLNQTVFFRGWCDRDLITRHYHNADVFVMSSDFEGMPNVILEAMASSLAIIATKAPGTDELVINQKNGFLIDKTQLGDFASYLKGLLAQQDALWSLQNASFELVQKYTWQSVSESYRDLIEGCLSES